MNKQTTLTIFALTILLASMLMVSAVSVKDVSATPSEVAPGETVSVSIEIENIFEDDVFNLNVKLDLTGADVPFAPFQSSSEKFLDELRDGDEEKFTFKLIVLPETASGIYKIPVAIDYEDEDQNESSKTELISVIVNSEPELKTSLESSEAIIQGKENLFSVKVVNSGLADVKFLYVKVNDVSGVKFLSDKEPYLGDINSDDFDSAKFTVFVSENAASTINMPVILKFKDATNKEFTETKTVTLKTYSLKEAQNLGLVKKPNYTTYIIVIVVIVGFIVYRKLKKRRKRRK